ncbi:hypothetical protein [Peribacillus frigoritolerans]|uniref:Uncharacterized protein n=1 Tax=Peribacillus frigoritolerans TaxID=450367 RepID=A0AAJ1VAU6_9BACI|nr:hypothetical protein [Peribacillus frigoritolerans]MDM5282900.1 hypothetical protein [Peribacillus frigoritolerans]
MDKEIKLEWLFWTMDEQLPLGELKVKAVHESGKRTISKGEIVKKETQEKETQEFQKIIHQSQLVIIKVLKKI